MFLGFTNFVPSVWCLGFIFSELRVLGARSLVGGGGGTPPSSRVDKLARNSSRHTWGLVWTTSTSENVKVGYENRNTFDFESNVHNRNAVFVSLCSGVNDTSLTFR